VLFGKKTIKGTKGVFSSKDVEKYLQDIMDLEKEVKTREILVTRFETQLSTTTRELNQLRKQVSKQDTTIQELRAENIDMKTRLTELEGKHGAMSKEQAGSLEKLKAELAKAPARDEYESVRDERDRLARDARDVQKALESRDVQIRKLNEENLKLKDKLKFLKEESGP
jgi:chromosome segregation ATPase